MNKLEKNQTQNTSDDKWKAVERKETISRFFWVHTVLSGASFVFLISYVFSTNYPKSNWLILSSYFWVSSLIANGTFSYLLRMAFINNDPTNLEINRINSDVFHDLSKSKYFKLLSSLAYASATLGILFMLAHVSLFLGAFAGFNTLVFVYLHQQAILD